METCAKVSKPADPGRLVRRPVIFEMIAGSPGSRDYLFAAIKWSQTDPNAWGDPGFYVSCDPMWAQVSMTPFSQYKGWLAEGGIRNALVVSGPAVKRPRGSINHGLMHGSDLMPTLLEVAKRLKKP